MKTKVYSLLLVAGMFVSCDHFLGVEQKGKVIPHTVEDYNEILNHPIMFDITNPDLMIPELLISDHVLSGLEVNQSNGYKWEPYQYLPDENDDNYSTLYSRIYACNEIINYIDDAESNTLNETLRTQVKGWAHADRARCYWGLVNLYGAPYSPANKDKPGVPLVLKNSLSQKARRATVGEVYDQINSDLRVAAALTPETVDDNKKVKACRQGVQAFQARVWLYMNQLDSAWVAIQKAFEKDVPLLDYNDFVDETELGNTVTPWIGNELRPAIYHQNKEIIWYAGVFYYIYDFNVINVTSDFLKLFNKASDLRYLFDYGKVNPLNGTVYNAVCYFAMAQDRTYMISGSDMYLLKAEILARRGDYTNAVTALNELRKHRYLQGSNYELTASDGATALQLVKEERKRELGCTFISWFDLRRYQAYGETIPTFKRTFGGKTVTLEPGSNLYTLSIPRYVIGKNPNIEQNPR